MVRLMLVLGLVLSLAACGGSSDGLSRSEEEALQERVDAAEEAARLAEEEKRKAEEEQRKAEEEKRQAEEAKRLAEEEQRRAEEEQERQRQAAEDARRRAEAEQRERERLAAEAEKARLAALAAESNLAIAGLRGTVLGSADPTVNPKYRAPAGVSAPSDLDPGVTFRSPSGASAGSWYVTTAQNQGSLADDTIVVYSDVDAPKATPIGQVHTDEDTAADSSVFEITIADTHANLIGGRSSVFPTGGNTNSNVPITIDTDDPPDGTNDVSANIPGTFDGASGNYQCESTSPCTIRHTGAGYILGGGTWKFRTSDSRTVQVTDVNFMHFGWWRRKTTDGFAYRVFSASTMANNATVAAGTGFAALTGTANYSGPAIGQYAIYQPLSDESNHGEFKATARFTANFDTDMLSGTVSGFDVNSGWSLTLKETGMAGGTVTAGAVSWTFDGNTVDGGAWDGVFHSETSPYAGQIPEGLTGEFDADFGTVGKIQGAYGAHYTP